MDSIENRNILLVINPASGKSSYQKKLRYLEQKLKAVEMHYQLFFTEHKAHGKLAETLLNNSSISEVLVLGGDGTLNYVVNEIQGRKLPISIVSNGTGNDSVKSLHGVLDFEKQVDIVLNGVIRKYDLGLCGDRYFVNGVGIGFDGEVVKEMVERGNKRGTHLDYLLIVLRIVAGFKEQMLKFSLDGVPFQKKILLMTISNGTTFGGGFIINPFAKTNDGLLDVCIINEIASLKRFWHLPKLKTGAHHKMKQTEFHLASNISIEATDQLVAHLDGEYIGHPPFEISIEKELLQIRTPR